MGIKYLLCSSKVLNHDDSRHERGKILDTFGLQFEGDKARRRGHFYSHLLSFSYFMIILERKVEASIIVIFKCFFNCFFFINLRC